MRDVDEIRADVAELKSRMANPDLHMPQSLLGLLANDVGPLLDAVSALERESGELRERTCPHVEAGELLLIDELRAENELLRAAMHVPQIAEQRDGRYGVICAGCSWSVGDYVHVCREGRTMPIGPLVRAALATSPADPKEADDE